MSKTASVTAASGHPAARASMRLRVAFVVASFVAVLPPTQAADANAGKTKAAQCAACHGPNGIAVLPEAPNLAGQVEGYLIKSLKDYRSGARRHEQMSVMAKGLSDRDIENLAAHYHQLPAGGQGAER